MSDEEHEMLEELCYLRQYLANNIQRSGDVDYISRKFFRVTAEPIWKYAYEVADMKRIKMHPKLMPVLDEVLGLLYRILSSHTPPTSDNRHTQHHLLSLCSNLKILRNISNKNRLLLDLAGSEESENSHRFVMYCFALREASHENESAFAEACLGVLRAQCFCIVRDLVLFY